jgi:GT2 family glycosyltransferase
MKTPLLSIIIVNFNTFEYTKQCIESVFNSDLDKKEYEIILIDNASSDKSSSKLRALFSNIQIIENQENSGFAYANNLVIQKAKGAYVLLLNPDTIVQKDTLSTIVMYMENHKDVGIATCRVEFPNGRIDDGCHRGFPTPWNALCHFSGLASLFPQSTFFDGYHLGYQNMNTIHEIDACVGAFMMIRREVGEQLHWLDEEYFWYGEDLDFCYRAKKLGYKIMYIPDTRIIHYKGVASGIKKHTEHLSTADLQVKQRATKARFAVMRIFYQKHYQGKYPTWLMALVMAGIRLKEFITLKQLH